MQLLEPLWEPLIESTVCRDILPPAVTQRSPRVQDRLKPCFNHTLDCAKTEVAQLKTANENNNYYYYYY